MQVSDKTKPEIIKIMMIIIMESELKLAQSINLFNFLVLTNKSTESFTLIG